MPVFTGRNVPLEEISAATGLSMEELKAAIRDGDFEFAVFIGNRADNRVYCSDKKVWEEIGYFNGQVGKEINPENVKQRVFANGEL